MNKLLSAVLVGLSFLVSEISGAQVTQSIETAIANPQHPDYGIKGRQSIPSISRRKLMQSWASSNASAATVYTAPLNYHGGPVMTPRVYLIFFGSQWGTPGFDANGNMTFSGDAYGVAPALQALFKAMGTGGEYASGVATEYCSGVAFGSTSCPDNATHVGYPTGGALAGVWYDSAAASPQAATSSQLAGEALSAATHFGNDSTGQYFIVSPPGTTPDGFPVSLCAAHYWGAPYIFASIPYIPGSGNCYGNLAAETAAASHELVESVTDPFGTGWYNSSNTNGEIGDVCAFQISNYLSTSVGRLAVQDEYSNLNSRCMGLEPVLPLMIATPYATTLNAGWVFGSSSVVNVTLRNNQPRPVYLSGLTSSSVGSGAGGQLVISGDLCSGNTLSIGATCSFAIQYKNTGLGGFQNFSVSSGVFISGMNATNISLPYVGQAQAHPHN